MDLCTVLATQETLSATQIVCLWLGCKFGLNEPQAALAGLMVCVTVLTMMVASVGAALEQLDRR